LNIGRGEEMAKNNGPIIKMLVAAEMKKKQAEIEKHVISIVMSAFLITLHDKHKFSKKKLTTLYCQVNDKFKDVEDKFVTVNDYVEWVEEYLKL
jgi:hypothetical protein